MEWGDEWGELWGGKIAEIETHKVDGAARLLFQFKDATLMQKLACIMAERAQPIENMLADLIAIHDINTAYGFLQDDIGDLIGILRQAFSDDDYRVRQRAVASILIPNRRTTPGLLEMLRILLNDPTSTVLDTDVQFQPNFSTLVDPETSIVGTADGTTYNTEADGRNFDGATDRLDWTGAPTPNLAITPWTISAKVNVSSFAVTSRIFSSESAAITESLSIDVNTLGQIRVVHIASGTDLDIVSNAALVLNADTIVTVTSDGTNDASGHRIYLGGLESSQLTSISATGTKDDTDFSYSLGGRIIDDVPNLTGVISEVVIWNKQLLADEVLLQSNNGQRNIDYFEVYPKGFRIEINDLGFAEAASLVPFIRKAKPVTYNATFLAIPVSAFGFDDSSSTIVTSTLGFGDSSGTITAGGPFAGLFPI